MTLFWGGGGAAICPRHISCFSRDSSESRLLSRDTYTWSLLCTSVLLREPNS